MLEWQFNGVTTDTFSPLFKYHEVNIKKEKKFAPCTAWAYDLGIILFILNYIFILFSVNPQTEHSVPQVWMST